jgi:hypothetical protein
MKIPSVLKNTLNKIPSVIKNTLSGFKEALKFTTNLKSLENAEVCKRIHDATTSREYLNSNTSSDLWPLLLHSLFLVAWCQSFGPV